MDTMKKYRYLLVLLVSVVVRMRVGEGQVRQQVVERRAHAVEREPPAARQAPPGEAHAAPAAAGPRRAEGC